MDKSLICFLPFSDTGSVTASIASLRSSGLVSRVFVVLPPGSRGLPDGSSLTARDSPLTWETMHWQG